MPKYNIRNSKNRILVAVAIATQVSCATVGTNGEINKDPYEKINRPIFQFNRWLDKYTLQPIARVYQEYVPKPIINMVDNIFSNLEDVTSLASNVFQLKPEGATEDFLRVGINSTFGLLGAWDIASAIGLPKRGEDFGQAMGYWGIQPGPYLMLPFLGPTTVRDGFGRLLDNTTNVMTYTNSGVSIPARVLNVVHTRANLLATTDAENQSDDLYILLRSYYLQKRRYDVYDGDPPDED